MSQALRVGSVVDFDEVVGLGTVATGDGQHWPFHCTQIANGTRVILPGTVVSFEVVAGHRGMWEAVRLAPLSPPESRPGAPN